MRLRAAVTLLKPCWRNHCRRPLDVGGAQAEAVGILLGGEPLVIVGGRPVLLLLEQGVQAALLRGRQAEDQPHALHRQRGIHLSAIEFGTRQRRNAASQAP